MPEQESKQWLVFGEFSPVATVERGAEVLVLINMLPSHSKNLSSDR